MKSAEAKEQQRLERRAQIRESAKELFLRHGFEGISTDALLAAAGIASKETLYRYYRSKEELFVEVVRSLTVEGPFLKGLLADPPSPRTLAELRSLVGSIIQELVKSMLQPDYLALTRMIVASLSRFPQLGELFRQAVPERALAALRELALRAKEVGLIASWAEPEAVARALIGIPLSYGIFDGLLRPEGPLLPPGPEVVEAIVAVVMEGLSGGISARSAAFDEV